MYMFTNDVFLNARCFMCVHIKMYEDIYEYLTVK